MLQTAYLGALDVSLHADLCFAVEGVCFGFHRFNLTLLKLAEHSVDYVAAVGLPASIVLQRGQAAS
jgi:hypothetical protein